MIIDIIELKDKGYSNFLNQSILIKGWVKTNRVSKNIGFLSINDGTTYETIQVVYEVPIDNFSDITNLTTGVSIEVSGKLIESLGGKQEYELKAESIVVVGLVDKDYPLQKKRHSFEFLREQAYLRGRTNTFSVIFHLRSFLAQEIHQFFRQEHFMYLHSPIITGSDAEGAGEMFHLTTTYNREMPFFDKEANLSVSGQLNAEAFALAFKKVYTFGPTFRAENSNTARHASEFWMLEPEVAFNDLIDNMRLAEKLLKYLVEKTLEVHYDALLFCDTYIEKGLINRLKNFLKKKISHITYTEAIEILQNSDKNFEHPVSWGIDLKTEHERFLTDEYFKGAVFVTDYPREIKAFYMKLNDDNKTVRAMDLLVENIGELIGGSQREDRLAYLEHSMMFFGLEKNDYEWYLNLRRYGSVPHSGFGLGFERLIMFITGIGNIRDTLPFPRVPGKLKF